VYKLLLCWRYLHTRYLALVCIVSVMLGVATLIVVNSVMAGFSTKLRERLHGLLSDVIIEATNTYSGFPDPDGMMATIRKVDFLDRKIEAMSPTLEVFAMLQFRLTNGQMMMRPVRLIGVDPQSRGLVGGFKEHLLSEANRRQPSFEIPPEARRRLERVEEWRQNEAKVKYAQELAAYQAKMQMLKKGEEPPLPPVAPTPPVFSFPRGIIVGKAIASYRWKNPKTETVEDFFVLHPGDQVRIVTYKGEEELIPASTGYLVCDYFMSEMSEYDSNYVFLPLDELQRLRSLENRATSIQVKLRDYEDARDVVNALTKLFPGTDFRVETWEDKQGPLLAAIAVEKGILNVLLFLIIGVAGFGILAIFSMIVTEKTRDIGILKALGASNGGVMKIFLSYGFLLGVVGAGLGTVLGLSITFNINEIEKWLGSITGHELFDRNVYYFTKIPTYVQALSVVLVNCGAVAIAVLFSILPALKAAWLHPVRALRYE
jgi:lipoprotein-releasing system permease protein